MAQKTDWVASAHATAMSGDRGGGGYSRGSRRVDEVPLKSPSIDAPFEISIDEEIDLEDIAKKLDEGAR
jgi:hypothetical protein